jgi:hypothetical protein
MDRNEQSIASFGDKKNDVPLPVKGPINPAYESSFDEFAGAWARTYASSFFAERGADYERVRLAYEFGARLANDKRFADRTWTTAESEIRGDWERRTDRPWDEAAAEIRKGWTDTRGEG